LNFNTKQAAEYIGISKNTLNNWRMDRSQQIPFLKLGTRVIYRSEDLDKYLESCRKEFPAKDESKNNSDNKETDQSLCLN